MLTVRDLLPATWRRLIYTLFGTALAVNAVLMLIPEGVVGRIVNVAAALGFGLAAGNTRGHVPPPEDDEAGL